MILQKLIYRGQLAGAAQSSADYAVAWRWGEGHWVPAIASASGSEPVCGWRRAFVLAEELAGRNLKDTAPAAPGHCLQIRGAAKRTAEALGHASGRQQAEL